MVKIIVLERNVMLRTGIVQLLSHVLLDSMIEGLGYVALDQPPDESRQGGLVFLSIPSPERRDSLILASERAFAPKGIILMLDGEPAPSFMHGLSPIVVGFVDKAVAPETFLARIRGVLAGCKAAPWLLDPAPLATAVAVSLPAPSPSRLQAPARVYSSESSPDVISIDPTPDVPDCLPAAARDESSLLGLTPRQYEVLVLLARGDALKTIARRLNITVATTKAHTEGLYQRLDVHNRNAAVYVARSRGAGLGWTPPQGSLELGQPGD